MMSLRVERSGRDVVSLNNNVRQIFDVYDAGISVPAPWPPGNSKLFRTLPTNLGGTNSFPCKTTIIFSIVRRSAR